MKYTIKLTLLTLLIVNAQAGAKKTVSPISKTVEMIYYDDGSIKESVLLKNGIKEGRSYSNYPDGSKKAEIYYVNGKVHGISKGWYNNGNLRGVEVVENGVRQGYRRSYYKSGKKRDVVLYKDGDPVEINMYHEDGSILYKRNYREDVSTD